MSIRFIKDVDFKIIHKLISELGYQRDILEFKKNFQRFCEDTNNKIAVYELDQKIIGLIAWSKSYLLVNDKTKFSIQAIIVDKEYQGKNIGKELMYFLENFATTYRPVIIDLLTGIRREKDGTHKFYDKLGYKNDGYMAKKYLRKEF